jgi:hypothetical protein
MGNSAIEPKAETEIIEQPRLLDVRARPFRSIGGGQIAVIAKRALHGVTHWSSPDMAEGRLF